MTTQRDDRTGPGPTDPAPGQAVPPEPIMGQVIPPPRGESEPDRPTGAAGPGDPSADPDRVVLDDPVQADDRELPDDREPGEDRELAEDRELPEDGELADDLGPAENGESAVDTETVTDREPEDAPPLVTGQAPGEVPAASPVPTSAPAMADTPDTIPAAALAEQQWPSIQSLFVDDPRGAVERAAAAATEVAASLVARLEREQADLRAGWQQNADTEQLRTALQRYRAFVGRLEGLA